MRSTILFSSIVTFAALTSAHGIVSSLEIGNDFYPGYNPFQDPYQSPKPQRIVRPFLTSIGNGPIEDVLSPAIVCNAGADTAPAAIFATVSAGSKITFFWTTWPDSHKGPTMTYLACCNGPCSAVTNAQDLEWFKIDHAGLLPDGTWISDEIIKNNSTYTVTIPGDIAEGEYLVRHELLALHAAGSLNGGQFYPMCANLKVTGGGSAKPVGVKFPGAYQPSDPGILINIWTTLTNYTIPGPDVYTAGGANNPGTPETSSPTTTPPPKSVQPSKPSTQPSTSFQPTTTSPPAVCYVPSPTASIKASPTKPSPLPTISADLPSFPAYTSRTSCFSSFNECMKNYNSCMQGGINRVAQVTCENYRMGVCEGGRVKCDSLAA